MRDFQNIKIQYNHSQSQEGQIKQIKGQPLKISNQKYQNNQCDNGNIVTLFCADKQCQAQLILLCSQFNCSCNYNHRKCSKFHVQFALNQINKKINLTYKIKSQIYQIFKRIKMKINQIQYNMIYKIDQNIQNQKSIVLTDIEKTFYQYCYRNQNYKKNMNNNNLNGKILSQMIENFQQIPQFKLEYFQQIKIFQYNLTKQIDKFSNILFRNQQFQIQQDDQQEIKKRIEIKSQLQNPQNLLNQKYNFQNMNIQPLIQKYKLWQQSSIIKNQFYENKLHKIFRNSKNKKKSIKLIFKASDHQFKIKEYFEKCGTMKNTLILCQTQAGNIIGGYTPLAFVDSKHKTGYITDQTKTSFVFSFFDNQRFRLRKYKQAIYRCPKKSKIQFGGSILHIGDKANIQYNNYTNLNCQVYIHDAYHNKKDYYLKLNGTPGPSFKIKQWEAYKVQLQANQHQ